MDKIDPIPLPTDRRIPLIDRTPPSTGQERRHKKEEKKGEKKDQEPSPSVKTDLDVIRQLTDEEKENPEKPDHRGSQIDIQV